MTRRVWGLAAITVLAWGALTGCTSPRADASKISAALEPLPGVQTVVTDCYDKPPFSHACTLDVTLEADVTVDEAAAAITATHQQPDIDEFMMMVAGAETVTLTLPARGPMGLDAVDTASAFVGAASRADEFRSWSLSAAEQPHLAVYPVTNDVLTMLDAAEAETLPAGSVRYLTDRTSVSFTAGAFPLAPSALLRALLDADVEVVSAIVQSDRIEAVIHEWSDVDQARAIVEASPERATVPIVSIVRTPLTRFDLLDASIAPTVLALADVAREVEGVAEVSGYDNILTTFVDTPEEGRAVMAALRQSEAFDEQLVALNVGLSSLSPVAGHPLAEEEFLALLASPGPRRVTIGADRDTGGTFVEVTDASGISPRDFGRALRASGVGDLRDVRLVLTTHDVVPTVRGSFFPKGDVLVPDERAVISEEVIADLNAGWASGTR